MDWTERLEVRHVVRFKGGAIRLEIGLLILLQAEELVEELLPEGEGGTVAGKDREIHLEEADGILGTTDDDILERLSDEDDEINGELNNIHEARGQPRQHGKHRPVMAAVVNNRADHENTTDDPQDEENLEVALNVHLVQPANVLTWRKVDWELDEVDVVL